MSTSTQLPVSEQKQTDTQVETKQEVKKTEADQGPTRPRAAEQPKYAYYVEPIKLEERPRRFLEAFAAILNHSNYGPVLDPICVAEPSARSAPLLVRCIRRRETRRIFRATGRSSCSKCIDGTSLWRDR